MSIEEILLKLSDAFPFLRIGMKQGFRILIFGCLRLGGNTTQMVDIGVKE